MCDGGRVLIIYKLYFEIKTNESKKEGKDQESIQSITTFERSVKMVLLAGLNWFCGTNLTLISDVDQDK